MRILTIAPRSSTRIAMTKGACHHIWTKMSPTLSSTDFTGMRYWRCVWYHQRLALHHDVNPNMTPGKDRQ